MTIGGYQDTSLDISIDASYIEKKNISISQQQSITFKESVREAPVIDN
jgi:hypothetical protein